MNSNYAGRFSPERRFRWVSGVEESAQPNLHALSRAMREYYRTPTTYYANIAYAGSNWSNPAELGYQEIVMRLEPPKILEVGCGAASILSSGHVSPESYSGCEFSGELIAANKEKWPRARFVELACDRRLPFEDEEFDTILSVFVIEHCVFPHLFLLECARILRPHGVFLLLCPDFLGRSRIDSQRLGFSSGTGREKLSNGRFLDAAVTAWDSRIRLPVACHWRRWAIKRKPRFYINLRPVCLTDPFKPDCDAVYLTSEAEIRKHLAGIVEFDYPNQELAQYLRVRRLMCLCGRKLASRILL